MKKVSKIRAPVNIKRYRLDWVDSFLKVCLAQLLYCTQRNKGLSNEKK